MSKSLYFILITCITTMSFSCKMDLFEEYEYNAPEVEILGFEQISDTTYLEVDVNSFGQYVHIIGVSHSIYGEPSVESESQILFDGSEGILKLPVTGIEPEVENSFLVYAGNGYALGESAVETFMIPEFTAPEIPCELNENTMYFGESRSNISSVSFTEDDDQYKISVNAQGPTMSLTFAKPPTTGVYTVHDHHPYDFRDVKVDLRYVGIKDVSQYKKIYIEKLGENNYNIDFCDLSFPHNQETYLLAGNFTLE